MKLQLRVVGEKLSLQDGAPEAYYFRGFIPSYTHVRPWYTIGFAGVISLPEITRGAPSCNNRGSLNLGNFSRPNSRRLGKPQKVV